MHVPGSVLFRSQSTGQYCSSFTGLLLSGPQKGRWGALWAISGCGGDRGRRVDPQDRLVQVIPETAQLRVLAETSVFDLTRTHKTTLDPLPQTIHVPESLPTPVCWSYFSLLELSRSIWKHQSFASGQESSPHLNFNGVDGLGVTEDSPDLS